MTLAKKGFANILPAMRYYKKQIIFVVLFVAILLGMVAFCAVPDYTTVEKMNPLTAAMLNQVDNLVNPMAVDVIKERVKVTYEDGALIMGGQTISDTTFIDSINELCQGVGVIFVCITFFISLFCSKDRDLQEEIIKKCVFFVAALALVWYAQDICYGIAGIGTEIAEKIAGSVEGGVVNETTKHTIKQNFFAAVHPDEQKWYSFILESASSLGILVELALPSLLMWICFVITKVTCWSRAIEIVMLSTFSPLAFADASGLDHFGNGSGSRFIKNMCALSISGAIILFVMLLCASLSVQTINPNGTVGEIVESASDILIISLAQTGLVMKAQSISKTLLGVG